MFGFDLDDDTPFVVFVDALKRERCVRICGDVDIRAYAKHAFFAEWAAKAAKASPGAEPVNIFDGTLIDGELMESAKGAAFVVFDVVACCGYAVGHLPFHRRLLFAECVANACAHDPGHRQPVLRLDRKPIDVACKTWVPFAPGATLAPLAETPRCDGLIFAPRDAKRNAPGTFKWKRRFDHTVDLLYRDGAFWAGNKGGLVVPQDVPATAVASDVVGRLCDGVVYEISATNAKATAFTCVCVREDKRWPNEVTTVQLTMQNIKENITLDELQTFLHGGDTAAKTLRDV